MTSIIASGFTRLLAFGALAGGILSGCGEGFTPKGAFVPYEVLRAETAQLPFSCADHDAGTDSCRAITTSVVRGDMVVSEGRFLTSVEPTIELRATLTETIVDGRTCATSDDLDFRFVGPMDPVAAEFMIGAVQAEFEPFGLICTSYYRTGTPGVYIEESVGQNGEQVTESVTIVRFFAERKPLYF